MLFSVLFECKSRKKIDNFSFKRFLCDTLSIGVLELQLQLQYVFLKAIFSTGVINLHLHTPHFTFLRFLQRDMRARNYPDYTEHFILHQLIWQCLLWSPQNVALDTLPKGSQNSCMVWSTILVREISLYPTVPNRSVKTSH